MSVPWKAWDLYFFVCCHGRSSAWHTALTVSRSLQSSIHGGTSTCDDGGVFFNRGAQHRRALMTGLSDDTRARDEAYILVWIRGMDLTTCIRLLV